MGDPLVLAGGTTHHHHTLRNGNEMLHVRGNTGQYILRRFPILQIKCSNDMSSIMALIFIKENKATAIILITHIGAEYIW